MVIKLMKKAPRETQTLRAGCIKAEPKIFVPPAADEHLHLQVQFGENRYMQCRVIVVTDPQAHPQTNKPQTGPITIHCADKLSAQCNNLNVIASEMN